MASLAPRELKIRKIIDKTLGVIEINAVAALVFVLVLAALGTAITFGSASSAPLQVAGGQLLRSVMGMVCGYFLLVAMMRRLNLSQAGADVLLPYLGLSVLYSLGVMLGMIAIILPGLFLMTRWSIAQPLLVARGGGVKASFGESWDRTKGNEISIFVGALALAVIPIALMIAASMFFEKDDLVGIVVSEIATSGISLIYLAMGVALYGLLVGGGPAPNPSN